MENEGEKFIVTVKDKVYIITQLLTCDETPHKDHPEERFQIERGCEYLFTTGGEYLFTIEMKADLLWEIVDEDVKPIDKELVQNIGDAITQTGYLRISDMPQFKLKSIKPFLKQW